MSREELLPNPKDQDVPWGFAMLLVTATLGTCLFAGGSSYVMITGLEETDKGTVTAAAIARQTATALVRVENTRTPTPLPFVRK